MRTGRCARAPRPVRCDLLAYPSLLKHHTRFAHTSKNPSCGTRERLTAGRAHIADAAGRATVQAEAPATHHLSCPRRIAIKKRRAHSHDTPRPLMQGPRTPRVVALRREKSFSVRRKPRPGAPLCPTCTRLWGRWPSWVCAYVSGTNLRGVREGTCVLPVLPELTLTTAFPITLLSVSRRGISQACG